MQINQKRIAQFVLKLAASAVLVYLLILKIDWAEVLFYLKRISVWQIVLYVAVLLVGMVISSFKWQMLAKFKGLDISVQQCFQLYLTGTFINNFLPSFIGGDTYRAYQIGKKDKRFAAAAASVVMDRLTGLLGAMLLSVFFAALNWQVIFEHKVLLSIASLILLCLFGVLSLGLIMKLPFWKHLAKFIPKKVLEFLVALHEYYAHKKIFLGAMTLSVVFGLVGLAVLNFVIFWALGIQVGLLNYLSVIFLISIVSAVPISVGNIGVQEWAYVTFFGFFGVSSSAVIAVSIIIRILQMIVSFTALPLYLKNRKAV